MRIVVLGLSLSSSWGNGHATTFRALLRGLAGRGHDVTFLERERPWYAANRDLADPWFCRLRLYESVAELRARHGPLIEAADAVILGSYVPDGVEIGHWLCATAPGLVAFYDIDTPVTLAKLERGDDEYLSADLVPRFDLYLSFTGGPILDRLERELGARLARPLYCAVDETRYRPLGVPRRWALGYLGTYSADRQAKLEALLLEPARALPEAALVVAGPQYPKEVAWPANVERLEHLPPHAHPAFYGAQHLTLNVTREAMVASGHAPSVRLFEAAACGVPVASDWWPGLEGLFRPGEEIFIVRSSEEVVRLINDTEPERLRQVGEAARARVLREHTAGARARELELHLSEAAGRSAALPRLRRAAPQATRVQA
jgi:spore maturation protein CgeB